MAICNSLFRKGTRRPKSSEKGAKNGKKKLVVGRGLLWSSSVSSSRRVRIRDVTSQVLPKTKKWRKRLRGERSGTLQDLETSSSGYGCDVVLARTSCHLSVP